MKHKAFWVLLIVAALGLAMVPGIAIAETYTVFIYEDNGQQQEIPVANIDFVSIRFVDGEDWGDWIVADELVDGYYSAFFDGGYAVSWQVLISAAEIEPLEPEDNPMDIGGTYLLVWWEVDDHR